MEMMMKIKKRLLVFTRYTCVPVQYTCTCTVQCVCTYMSTSVCTCLYVSTRLLVVYLSVYMY